MSDNKPTLKGKPRAARAEVISLSQDQWVEYRISSQQERLVGRVVVRWSALEAALQGVIWEFLDIPMAEGRIITSKMDAGTKVQMVRSLGNLKLREKYAQALLDCLSEVEDCRDDRNFVAHGAWVLLQPEGIPNAMSLKPKAALGTVVGQAFPPKQMYALIARINRAIIYLAQLEREMHASRDIYLKERIVD